MRTESKSLQLLTLRFKNAKPSLPRLATQALPVTNLTPGNIDVTSPPSLDQAIHTPVQAISEGGLNLKGPDLGPVLDQLPPVPALRPVGTTVDAPKAGIEPSGVSLQKRIIGGLKADDLASNIGLPVPSLPNIKRNEQLTKGVLGPLNSLTSLLPLPGLPKRHELERFMKRVLGPIGGITNLLPALPGLPRRETDSEAGLEKRVLPGLGGLTNVLPLPGLPKREIEGSTVSEKAVGGALPIGGLLGALPLPGLPRRED
ncbi:hypothetical protein CVT24_008114 [Panaeolus cyanescens]|uniref:Uncharacterized protein n=1 Tax=Panaeolus cyanescens TaxID=181874 RepID=A0A409YLI1_9AGAR|nr:hypothetical protein CVT24_008114 [Panaeolus cyanescens]